MIFLVPPKTGHVTPPPPPPPPPTTQTALIQHIKRAAYQAVCICGQETTICQMETKSLAYWGWKKQDDMWQIFWTVLPPIAQSCQQLTQSGCKTEFRGRCKCYCFSLPFIALCRPRFLCRLTTLIILLLSFKDRAWIHTESIEFSEPVI